MRNIEYGNVPLSEIELGERRREDYGDIDKLAEGIRKVGLLHPLIVQRVNGHYQVVVGGRRLKALQKLNVKSAPVRLYETLSEQELREIELEENENRKDLRRESGGEHLRPADKSLMMLKESRVNFVGIRPN